MIKNPLLGFVMILVLLGCSGDSKTIVPPPPPPPPPLTIEQQLSQLPKLSVEKRESPFDGYDYYFLKIEQAVAHDTADSAKFQQRIRLLLKDINAPIVLRTNGYGIGSEQRIRLLELTTELAANQVEVEHRYFNDSTPDPVQWQHLTIKQAANDHYQIIETLSQVLKGKWLATGRSKGGMAATYLKRFYPQSVAGVVAYVAPLSLQLWDERFADYSLSVIEPQCAEKYKNYQREALLRIDELATIIADWATQRELTTNSHGYSLNDRLQAEIALSWIEMGSDFVDLNCDAIPTTEDETLAFAEFMYQGSQFVFLVDEGLKLWLPYHMHAAAELGNFAAPIAHLEDLLSFDVKDFKLNLLGKAQPDFDPQVMQDIHDWAKHEASEMIMIYAEQDIFTGGAYPMTTDINRDNQLHIEPGVHRLSIADMSEDARNEIFSTVRRWVE